MAVSEASDELLEALDQLLFYLEAAEDRKGGRSLARGRSLKARRGKTANPLRGWQGILPLHTDFLETFYAEDHQWMGDVDLDDLAVPLNICMCAQSTENEETLLVHRFRAHSPLRGQPRVRWYNVSIRESGKAKGNADSYVVLTKGASGSWHFPTSSHNPGLGPRNGRTGQDAVDLQATRIAQVALGFAFEAPTFWHVDVGYHKDGPSVAIQTDAQGVLELFRNRDVLGGGDRRDALLHWVEEHYRRKPSWDAEVSVKVRSHLRGQTDFLWMGMHAHVRPSAEEMQYFLEGDQRQTHNERGVSP